MTIERITRIRSEALKTSRSSYGTWKVLADASFYNEETGKSWEYPSKTYYFWSKNKALKFIATPEA